MADDLLKRVAAYYAERLEEHGATARGVDWNSSESQHLRFDRLLTAVDHDDGVLIDYGCGYGALRDYLERRGSHLRYVGYDACQPMIETGQQRRPDRGAVFTSSLSELQPSDYCVASGIFNVKLDIDEHLWREHVLSELSTMFRLTRRAMAFNVLTIYSDPERRRRDLFYADPCELFDFCKRRLSRHVALLHDYDLYEFTIVVRVTP